jgi:alkylresorcinol/alkylpyrone synthase
MHNKGLVLKDFKSVKVSPDIDQGDTCNIICWAMAKAYAIKNKLPDNEANEYYSSLKKAFNYYALSSKHIEKRKLRAFSEENINVPDILKIDGKFLPLNFKINTNIELFEQDCNPEGILIQDRMAIYQEKVIEVMDEFYSVNDQLIFPDDIVHVTCAGYIAPSPIQAWLSKHEKYNTVVTNSYHMGCYASIPSIRTAAGLFSSSFYELLPPKQKVDVVHTEYLSLHFDLLGKNIDNIISMTLFADGFIKYSLIPEDQAGNNGLKIIKMYEKLLPNSLEEMKWVTGSNYFFMTLSANVPMILKRYIYNFVQEILSLVDNRVELDNWYFALHPGGPKIIDFVQSELGLSDKHFKYSRKVLKENGNMSSATVPHILQLMLEDKEVPSGSSILSMAFGPGLVATAMVLKKL